MTDSFVPGDYVVPLSRAGPGFRLEPLGPQHDPDITEVRSWVTASRADLDAVLHETVASWLAADWPFTNVRYRSDPP